MKLPILFFLALPFLAVGAQPKQEIIWLQYPPSSPVDIVAAVKVNISRETPIDSIQIGFDALARSIDGEACILLRSPKSAAITRADLLEDSFWPAAANIPINLRAEWFVVVVKRSTTASEVHPDGSLLTPMKGHQKWITSPYAPDKPALDVSEIPEKTTILCPYTQKPFILW